MHRLVSQTVPMAKVLVADPDPQAQEALRAAITAAGHAMEVVPAAKDALEADSKIYDVIKAGILAYMQGYAPAVAIEMARKTVPGTERPSFYDLEAALAK